MQGQQVGPYMIVKQLGVGGMGAVYEAVQDSIERRVAIKVLLPSVAQDGEIAKRFVNEARAVNRVNHPGLVQVSDFGQLDSGAPYIVMEFLKGETLRQRLRWAKLTQSAALEDLDLKAPRGLDRAAREHVLKKWRFQPAMQDGVPVQAWGRVPIVFTLGRA